MRRFDGWADPESYVVMKRKYTCFFPGWVGYINSFFAERIPRNTFENLWINLRNAIKKLCGTRSKNGPCEYRLLVRVLRVLRVQPLPLMCVYNVCTLCAEVQLSLIGIARSSRNLHHQKAVVQQSPTNYALIMHWLCTDFTIVICYLVTYFNSKTTPFLNRLMKLTNLRKLGESTDRGQ